MDLLPDTEQAEIAAAARALLGDLAGPARLRDGGPTAHGDPELWRVCAEQGWFGLAVPAEQGGVGYGAAEEALLFREVGRALAAGPFLGTVLAAHLAASTPDAELFGRLTGGRSRAAVAVAAEPTLGGDLVGATFTSFDAADVDHYLLLGTAPDSAVALVAAAGVTVTVLSCFDPASRRAELVVRSAPLVRVDAPGAELRRRAELLTSAMLAGIAEATCDDSVAHARTREQFGSPIGAFQAVKHRCADAATRADAAAQLTFLAALSVSAGTDDATRLCSAALHIAADAALRNAADNVQNHGGIGFTAEADAHLYLKRAHVLAQSLGTLADQRAALLAD